MEIRIPSLEILLAEIGSKLNIIFYPATKQFYRKYAHYKNEFYSKISF